MGGGHCRQRSAASAEQGAPSQRLARWPGKPFPTEASLGDASHSTSSGAGIGGVARVFGWHRTGKWHGRWGRWGWWGRGPGHTVFRACLQPEPSPRQKKCLVVTVGAVCAAVLWRHLLWSGAAGAQLAASADTPVVARVRDAWAPVLHFNSAGTIQLRLPTRFPSTKTPSGMALYANCTCERCHRMH